MTTNAKRGVLIIALAVPVLGTFIACGGGVGDPWNVPHPGKDSYGNLEDMAKDFDAVYIVDPKGLNYSDDLSEVAIGISHNSDYATIYLRFLTTFQKFTADLLRQRGHTDNPGVRYILESNQLRFNYGWTAARDGFHAERLAYNGEYVLTDKERHKRSSRIR